MRVVRLAVVIWLLSFVLAWIVTRAFAGEVLTSGVYKLDGPLTNYIAGSGPMEDIKNEPKEPGWKNKENTMIDTYEYALSEKETKRIRGRRRIGLGSEL